MRSEFKPVLANATLTRDESLTRLLETHKKVPGIYLWVLRHETKEYKLYIGQTNSLANRLLNYVNEFQAHLPNDYKLRIFAAFLAEHAPQRTPFESTIRCSISFLHRTPRLRKS